MKIICSLLWSSFIAMTVLHAQKKAESDSILSHYIQTNPQVDSLYQITLLPEDDTLKVHSLAYLYNIFLYKAPALAKDFALKELEISENLDYPEGKGWGNYHMGAYHQNAGETDSARMYYMESLKWHKSLGDRDKVATVLSSLANLEFSQGNYDRAIQHYDASMEIFKDVSMYRYAITQGDKANIYINKGFYRIALAETLDALRVLDTIPEKPWRRADAQRQVGYIEFLRMNYENALSYFVKAAEVYEQEEDMVYTAKIFIDIGNVHFELDELQQATAYFERSLSLSREHGISETEGDALYQLGRTSNRRAEYAQALKFLKEALGIHMQNNYRSNILRTQNELGRTYLGMGKMEDALSNLGKTIKSATGEGPITELKDAYAIRFLAYQKLGDHRRAVDDQLMLQKLKDSVFNTSKSQQIEELRTIYETEKREQQLALQQNEIAILEQEARINNLQRILLGGGLGLTLLVFGIGYYGLQQKVKRNRLEKEKLDAELAFKKKELTTHALHLAKKNEVLEGIREMAIGLKDGDSPSGGYRKLIRTIEFDLKDDNNWENFSRYFNEVHKDFNHNVKSKYPQVTSNELRLLALLKMNLSSKEIASILNISPEGIKKARYRLRKKMGIQTEDSLQDLVLAL